jgi:hypothetical protein
MIDKISGKVAYAVISFGGFLGPGRRLLSAALAQSQILYESSRIPRWCYRGSTKRSSEISSSTERYWSDRARDREVYDYYKTRPCGIEDSRAGGADRRAFPVYRSAAHLWRLLIALV